MRVRAYTIDDLPDMIAIWNSVVEGGVAFPQTTPLTWDDAVRFFAEQTYVGVACAPENEQVVGLYILHPNNIGRCAHIANASYAVARAQRGRHIGEALVRDCLAQARALGFRIMQFNAVVRSNLAALHLYDKLGFVRLGVIPGGFCMADGHFEDIVVLYHLL